MEIELNEFAVQVHSVFFFGFCKLTVDRKPVRFYFVSKICMFIYGFIRFKLHAAP